MTRFLRKRDGFTLVELVVVIVVIGILAALGGVFIARPIEGYVALNRRAALVDAADNALRRMQRDIRQALPNSILLSPAGQSLQLLHTTDGGRYRAEGSDALDFAAADNGFDVLGSLSAPPVAGQWLVIYNLAATGLIANAYFGDNRTDVAVGSTATHISFNNFQFPRPSPYRRFFLVDEQVNYICTPNPGNPTAGTLFRNTAAPGAPDSALVTRHVTACTFTYAPGTSQRAGLVTLSLTLAADGEQVTLLQQVHVENAP